MSDEPVAIPSRQWLRWVLPAIVLALSVLVWYRMIDRRGWWIVDQRRDQEISLVYAPAARWGLPALSLAAVLAAAAAARAAVARKADHRHPAVMTCLCVGFAMVLYWLVEIHGVWEDRLTIGPTEFKSQQTQWLVQRIETVPYAAVSKVDVLSDRWIMALDGGRRVELRDTPLLRRGRQALEARLRDHGAAVVQRAASSVR